ncbi:BamA/TamA family outer membrane protein, partial [bacterium]|nr:BamA/TamA family outer membrane protein [bacterium]
MHIFKLYLILLIAVQLFGQSKKVVIGNIDTLAVSNYDDINIKLDSLLNTYRGIGEFFILDRISSDSLIQYNRKTIDVTIDTIIFKNDDDIRISVLNQIFKPLIESTPKIKTKKIFNVIVKSNPFIMENSEIYFGVNKKNKVGAMIDVKTNFNNYFSGLIGASRSEEQKWSVNGQMDIHLENQWRTANSVDLHWKRLDKESQILNLRYEEPHPFGLPIGVSVAYNQDLREGNYVNTKSAVGIIKTVPGIGKVGFGGKNTKINSTAKGDSLGLSNLTTQAVYIDGVIDYRNDYWLPTQGLFISFYYDVGKRLVSETNTVISSGQINVEKYLPLWGKNNVGLKIFGNRNWISSGSLHSGELIRYGGVNNLRGYTEDHFKSDWVIIPSVEYNVKLGSNQQVTLFSDFALQEVYKPVPYGYGIGFTQVTKNSVLKLYYGLGRGDSLKSG